MVTLVDHIVIPLVRVPVIWDVQMSVKVHAKIHLIQRRAKVTVALSTVLSTVEKHAPQHVAPMVVLANVVHLVDQGVHHVVDTVVQDALRVAV